MSIQLTRKTKAFVDISLAFEPNPVTKDISVLTNERAINNAIKNLVQTIPGEAAFHYNVGSSVRSYLFDVVDDGTAGLIRNEVERTITFNEPRVEVIDVAVEAQPDENRFVVNVTYEIVGYEQVFTVDFLLEPTRI